MKNWEDLTLLQKAFIGVGILLIGVFAPEIALLVQFGGIEVAFAFLAFYLAPAMRFLQNAYSKVKESIALALISYQTSASARPKVFLLQSSFCCLAFALTGSIAFSMFFFMPGMVFNTALI